MVGVRRPNANAEFYKLKERGPGGEEIVTSAWASREGSGRAGGGGGPGAGWSEDGGPGAGWSVDEGPGTGWSEDEGPGTGWSVDAVPLKGIRVKDEVRVDTREDSGGALSPV